MIIVSCKSNSVWFSNLSGKTHIMVVTLYFMYGFPGFDSALLAVRKKKYKDGADLQKTSDGDGPQKV